MSQNDDTEKTRGFKPPSARVRRAQQTQNTSVFYSCDSEGNEFLSGDELERISTVSGYPELDLFRCDHIVTDLLDFYEAHRFKAMENVLMRLLQTNVDTTSLVGIGGSQLALTVASIHKLSTRGDTSLYVRLAGFLISSWDAWIRSAMNKASPDNAGAAPGPPDSPTISGRSKGIRGG
jgi:hypothetical protein